MQEAKFSINVRFNYQGYDSQYTLRSDIDGKALINQFAATIKQLELLGASPDRRWEAVKNGSSVTPAPKPVGMPTSQTALLPPACVECGTAEHMELIKFQKDGKAKEAWKCQQCQKWHYDQK